MTTFQNGDRVRVVKWIFEGDFDPVEAIGEEGTVTDGGVAYPQVLFDNIPREDGSRVKDWPMAIHEIEKVETVTDLQVGTVLTEEYVGKVINVVPAYVEPKVFEVGVTYKSKSEYSNDYTFTVDALVTLPGKDDSETVAVGYLTYDDDTTDFEYEYTNARNRFVEVR